MSTGREFFRIHQVPFDGAVHLFTRPGRQRCGISSGAASLESMIVARANCRRSSGPTRRPEQAGVGPALHALFQQALPGQAQSDRDGDCARPCFRLQRGGRYVRRSSYFHRKTVLVFGRARWVN